MGNLVPATPAIIVLQEQRLGFCAMSLSNWSTSGIPQIIGNVEVAGALYEFSDLEDILNWGSVGAGNVWVKLAPQIDDTIDAIWTATAPTWSDTKQGWYSPTVGEENQRYVFSATKVDASNATKKEGMKSLAFLLDKKIPTKEIITSGSGNWTVPSNVYRLKVWLAGGGGGGGGGSGFFGGVAYPGTNGSPGGNTTFGAYTALGALGGKASGYLGGQARTGESGSVYGQTGTIYEGGSGGGAGGGTGGLGTSGTGGNGMPAAGGGGGGGTTAGVVSGGGGGAGTVFTENTAIDIEVLPGQVFTYSVGLGGTAGSGGSNGGGNGGAGGSGIIIIEY